MSKAASPTDPARMAILANRFESIARQMAHTLHRTGRSGLINTARDLSCCILTADHELLSEAESLPSHVLVGPDIMSRWLKEWHPHVQRGDAFLHNSPYHGNSHAADHTIIVRWWTMTTSTGSPSSPKPIRPTSAIRGQPHILVTRETSMRKAR